MAEITEVFDDLGQNVKKLGKNKKFLIAAGAVGAVALIAGIIRNRNADSSGPYEAVGYGGYPTVGGGGGEMTGSTGDDYGYLEGLISDTSASDTAYFEELYRDQESRYDEMRSNVSALSERLVTTEETITAQQKALQMQNDLAQMRANSELYNNIGDKATRDALHAENLSIAQKYGWVYDDYTGTYSDENGTLYTSAQMQAKMLAGADLLGGKTAPDYTTGFDANKDYQKEINQAILSGASATVINKLNQQRNAKIGATGSSVTQANSGYDKNLDYTALINNAKRAGASASVIANLQQQREAKIKGENLNQDGTKKTGASSGSSSSSSKQRQQLQI